MEMGKNIPSKRKERGASPRGGLVPRKGTLKKPKNLGGEKEKK
jgi:hypothetical protein